MLTTAYVLGDTVNSVTGVVGYSFSKYRIHPTVALEFVNSNERTEAPELKGEGDLRIASFNVLNYFNGDGEGAGFPTLVVQITKKNYSANKLSLFLLSQH